MATPTLIYCAGRNSRFTDIALATGFKHGSQLPNRVYRTPIHFADQDWRNPDRDQYMQALATYQPQMATVLDWEQPEQRDEVLSWAEQAAQHTQQIIIIPKVSGTIATLPRTINGKPIVLGYSVPTKYAGTQVPLWEFMGRPVHLLGGSPQKQMELAQYLNVVSADGNMAQKMATTRCQFWTNQRLPGIGRKYGYWVPLKEIKHAENDAPYKAFARSCQNIATAWTNPTHPSDPR